MNSEGLFMKKTDLITVIVPVYNSELYLDSCIRSIVSQTWKNLELILVEDGSPDHSAEICDEWSEKDERIIAIHTTNQGAGAARNKALDIAKGDCIAFVDSDDYISPIMLESLLSALTQDIDLVECEFYEVVDDNQKLDEVGENFKADVFTSLDAMKEHITDHYFRQVIWNKLYRRELIGDYRFPVGKEIDDEFWTYHIIGRARKVAHINAALYAYRKNQNSVMNLLSESGRLEAIEAREQRHKFVSKYYPTLEADSLISLYNICIFQAQKALLESANPSKVLNHIKAVMKRYPIKEASLKYRLLYLLADISLETTCKIRNTFKRGL